MGLYFHELPVEIFSEEQRPYLQRMNKELRDLFSLEGIIDDLKDIPHRSDKSIIRGKRSQVNSSRIEESGSTITPSPAFNDLPFVTVTNTTRLTKERALAVDSPITLLDAGANSSITIGLDTGILNPLLSHDPLQDKDLGDQHANYVYLTPAEDIRNLIEPTAGVNMALETVASSIGIGGGPITDAEWETSTFHPLIFPAPIGWTTYSSERISPRAWIASNIREKVGGGWEKISSRYEGMYSTMGGVNVADRSDGVWFVSSYPADSEQYDDAATHPNTDRRILMMLRSYIREGQIGDGRGLLTLGHDHIDGAGRFTAGSDNDIMDSEFNNLRARMTIFAQNSGAELTRNSPAPKVYALSGLWVEKSGVRVRGNPLWLTDTAAALDESSLTDIGNHSQNPCTWFAMTPGLTGAEGTTADRPSRIMSRWEMTGLSGCRAEMDGSTGTVSMWMDIVGEAAPMRGINVPRYVLESANRIMLRPGRTRVNVGGNPANPDYQAIYVWQGAGTSQPVHGAVEIDGRLRLWGEGAVYDSSPNASHASNQAAASGVDFFYNMADDLVYLYNPTGTTQQPKFDSGNINWSGSAVISANIIELDQSPNLTYLDYISFNGATHTINMGGLTSGSSDLVTLTFGLGSGTDKRFTFSRHTSNNTGYMDCDSATVTTTGGYGFRIDGGTVAVENNAFTYNPIVDATYDINVGDALRIVDDTGTANTRPVATVQWSVAAGSLPSDRGLLSVNYATSGGTTEVFNVRTNGIASPSTYIAESSTPPLGPSVPAGTFYATGVTATDSPFVFNTDLNVASTGDEHGIISIYSGGNHRTTIGQSIFTTGHVRIKETGSDPYLEMEGASAVARRLTYDDTNDKFTTDTDLAVLALSLTVGDNATAGDPTITFDGATNTGQWVWDDSFNGFVISDKMLWTGNNQFTSAAHIGWGTSPGATSAITTSQSSGDANLTHISATVQNTQTSTGTNRSVVGMLFNANQENTTGKGTTVGAQFSARISESGPYTANTVTLRGGKFIVDRTSGDSAQILTGEAGLFLVDLLGGVSNTITNGYCCHAQMAVGGATANTITAGYYFRADSPTISSNGVITHLYGMFIDDLTSASRSTTHAIRIQSQNGAGAGAAYGNISFQGGNWNTGHLQLENSHVWNDATNNTVRVSDDGAAPASETDGFPIPLAFGEIYVEDNSTETTISSSSTYVQVTTFGNNGQSNLSTPDHTNDHITVDEAGTYMVMVSASILSGAGAAAIYEIEVKSNNGTVAHTNIHTDRAMSGGGGDTGSVSLSGLAVFAATDTVELWVQNKTNTVNITFEDATLTIIKVK